jgi:predicted RNase H-like nuclease (RuvC/YqgF family)
MENYVGRFYAADVLEYIVEYGRRLIATDKNLSPEIVALINRFAAQFERVQDLVTPTQKPIHEMTLAEFEKIMNI